MRFALTFTIAAILPIAAVAFISCNNSDAPSAPQDPHAALVARGRTVYQSVCIACHNTDPKKAGSLGPEVWGSSLELLQKRISEAGYPAGYTPKRQTHVMQALPQVQKDILAVHAYLNE